MSRTEGTSGAPILVIGGGPAGLTAGRALARRGVAVLVAEAGDELGGLARTVERDGYRFDLGGHRFFTKAPEIERIWRDALGAELLRRPRLSRIYWNGRFLDYPLRAGDVVRKLGPVELPRVMASYARATLRPKGGEASFEDWVVRRFGRRLFELFFRSYTEKVWGVPTSELRAEWAAQRIRNLSFRTAARAAVLGNRDDRVVSLISSFHYPRRGPGQLWQALARDIAAHGGEVRTAAPVSRLEIADGGVVGALVGDEWVRPAAVISSAPLADVPGLAGESAPPAVRAAAGGLRFRDFITVALVVDGADPFPDTWIYVHDPSVRVGRIQNFRSWSPDLVPPGGGTCLGLEYFCFAGDELWTAPDAALVDLATEELARLRLVDRDDVRAGHVIRVRGAYPIYDEGYGARVRTIRAWLDSVGNLQQIGRNGLHRYNNVDHSMLTALRAVDNVVDGARHDIWAVNAEGAYHEERGADQHPYRRAPAAFSTT